MVPLAVHSLQAQLAEDYLEQGQHLEALDLVDTQVNHLLEVSQVSTPLSMDRQGFSTVESEVTMDSHHPTWAPVGELEPLVPLL